MDFELYLFATSDGTDLQFPPYKYKEQFQQFIKQQIAESQLTILRENELVFYAYTRVVSSNKKNHLGMCIIFENNSFCKDIPKLYRLFTKVYEEVVLKRNILVKSSLGRDTVINPWFFKSENELKSIESILHKNINKHFQDGFIEMDSSFKQTKGLKIPEEVLLTDGHFVILKEAAEHQLLVVRPEKLESLRKTNNLNIIHERMNEGKNLNLKRSNNMEKQQSGESKSKQNKKWILFLEIILGLIAIICVFWAYDSFKNILSQ
jgi:hypothetical protein